MVDELIVGATDLLDVTENSLSLSERGWKLLSKLALPRLGTLRKSSGHSELRSSITAPDGTSWEFETRSSENQVRNGLAIAKEAFDNLGSEDFSTDDLDEEWQDRFWDDARRKYTEDARSVYASILAGELRHPGSVSKMSLSVLDDLDQETARTFQRYCTLAARFGDVTALLHEPSTMDCMRNGLAEFGIDYVDVGRLAEHDLVRDTNSELIAEQFFVRTSSAGRVVDAYFIISGVAYALEAVPEKNYKKFSMVLATVAGNELARMVEPSAEVNVEAYTQKLFEEMESQGAKVSRVHLGAQP